MPRDEEEEDRPRELPPGIIRARPLGSSSPAKPDAPTSFERAKRASSGAGEPVGANRITAIEEQQKRDGRVSIYVDGKFAIGLFVDVAAALGLRVGQTITPERLEEAAQAETLRRALEDAYTLLSFRDRAEKELADRLARKGYEEEMIATTLEKLREAGYLNDAAFARRWVADRGQSRGRLALAQELRIKGVDRETAAEELADAKDESAERESARLAAVRRVGENPTDRSREARARLSAFLQRRGFSWDIVRPVLAELYAVREGEGEEDGSEE